VQRENSLDRSGVSGVLSWLHVGMASCCLVERHPWRVTPGEPAAELSARDLWLCVPASRRVCPDTDSIRMGWYAPPEAPWTTVRGRAEAVARRTVASDRQAAVAVTAEALRERSAICAAAASSSAGGSGLDR
jgi:hypothetical protein